jgi:hypothetical protein
VRYAQVAPAPDLRAASPVNMSGLSLDAVSVHQNIILSPPLLPASLFSAAPISLGPSDCHQVEGSSTSPAPQNKVEEHPLLIYSEESLSNIIDKTIYKRK